MLNLHSCSCILTFSLSLPVNFKNKKQWEIVLTANEKWPLLPEIDTENGSLRCNTTTFLLPIDIKKYFLACSSIASKFNNYRYSISIIEYSCDILR